MAKKSYREFSVEDRHVSARIYGRRLKSGEVEPMDKSECWACGQTEGQIEAHREDYSWLGNESLVVLCCRCHRVLHMRDRWPDAWDYYRERVRQGWQWPASRAIGTIATDMRSMSVDGAKLVNDPRDRTVLDDIHDDKYMFGTPEQRQERLAELYRIEEEWKNGKRSPTLF